LTTIPSLPPTNPSHQAAQLAIPRPSPTPWLAIAGAKGGVGKTTLAVQLALHFARGGHRTLLVDFDPGCGNVGVHLRLSAPLDLEDVATGACAARDAVVDGPSGLGVLLGRSGPTALVGDDSAARDRALRAIEQLRPSSMWWCSTRVRASVPPRWRSPNAPTCCSASPPPTRRR
jgi:flagellar biosynthesis protein FlhG